jgi:hypothetical protein
MTRVFCLIIIFLNFNLAWANNIFVYDENVILLVGLKAAEISDGERGVLHGKRVIEVSFTDNWLETIKKTEADEVILKQNNGFTGLYTPNGDLVRNIVLNVDLQKPNPNLIPPATQDLVYKEQSDKGYITGGRIDPYSSSAPLGNRQDNKQIKPGWGYNSEFNKPKSKRSLVVDYLEYMPIDTVTPLNYPGNFDQHNLAWAYGIGVIPHIGSFIAARNRARANKRDYDTYKQEKGIPSYVERPVMYNNYNPSDPTNPITSDPNFIKYQEMPVSFQQEYPNY